MKDIVIKMLIKYMPKIILKAIQYLWKHNPNYLIMLLINSIVSCSICFYIVFDFKQKKNNIAFFAYKQGQKDFVSLRELENKLLNGCYGNNIHISLTFFDKMTQETKELYAHVKQLQIDNIGNYELAVGEINTKNSLFCFSNLSSMPLNKQTCLMNTKYLNPFYQEILFSDVSFDKLLDNLDSVKQIYQYPVVTLIDQQPFFRTITENTNFKITGDIYFSILHFQENPYAIFTIITTNGYNNTCDINYILSEIIKLQNSNFNKLRENVANTH
jgi:hypothetical protein